VTWSDATGMHFNDSGTRVSISEMCEEALKPEAERRIWNGLDFPGTKERRPYSLSRLDWAFLAYEIGRDTVSDQPPDSFRPRSHLNWGMMNTQNTYTEHHFDANGCLTWVKIKNKEGRKWWGVPAVKGHSVSEIDKIVAQSGAFDYKSVEWEFLCLCPGDILYVYSFTLVTQCSYSQNYSPQCPPHCLQSSTMCHNWRTRVQY